jgi:O-antigen/teichoic acid export membrane protein
MTQFGTAALLQPDEAPEEEWRRTLPATERDLTRTSGTDYSGRERLVRNVLTSWAAHFVFIIAGFVLPRIIDHNLGQTALGIWDFGWSITNYLSLTQLGIGSAVNRYVAMYRATNDHERLNSAVSSVMCIQLVAALIALGLTLLIALYLPAMFSSRLGQLVDEARWVVLLLGLSLVVQMSFESFSGVMTGCHQWGVHNWVNAGFYGMTVIAMLLALSQGEGLPTLAGITLGGRVLTEGTRVFLTYRLCPELCIRWQYVNWPQVREMFTFGSKTVISGMSFVLLYQTTNLLIVKYLGVGVLALYARHMALVQHSSVFVDKFAHVLTPTAGSLQAEGKEEELRAFFLEATQASMYLALPPVLLLLVLGSSILQLWMGSQYANGEVLALLAMGQLTIMSQSSIWTILRGMNNHGRVAIVRFVAAFGAVCLNFVILGYLQQDLRAVAMAVTLPLIVVDGIYAPLYACRQLGVPLRHYACQTWGRPLLCVLPFAGCLLTARLVFVEQPLAALAVGSVVGGTVLGFTYWLCVIPSAIRGKIRQRITYFF